MRHSQPITKWGPDDFELEMTSVWSFPQRGNWATHDAKWRGNWSPYIPRNLILRYSQPGDLILDQFAGGGTTLIETKLLGRDAIGIDVNPTAITRCQEKTNFKHPEATGHIDLRLGDARHLDSISDATIDLICTHPPYANIIHYSEGQNIPADLSNLKRPDFLEQLKPVASESFRVLKPGKFCAILIGDMRQKGHVIPLGFQTMQIFLDAGFQLKEIILKEQHNCRATGYWKTNSIKYNFLLLAHEYLFIFKK